MYILIAVLALLVGFFLGVITAGYAFVKDIIEKNHAWVCRDGKIVAVPDTYYMDKARAEAKKLLDTIYSK